MAWAIENPSPGLYKAFDRPCLWDFPAAVSLAALPGAHAVVFDQCPLGADTRKPTQVLYAGWDLAALQGACNHPSQSWSWTDWKGRPQTSWGPHPPSTTASTLRASLPPPRRPRTLRA